MENNNKNVDELGYAGGDTVNLKAVFGRIREKTEGIAEASKKFAGNVGELIKNSVKDNSDGITIKPAEVTEDPTDAEHIVIASEPPKKAADAVEEISLDLDDMKNQISQSVRSAMEVNSTDISKLVTSMEEVTAALDNVKIRLQAIQLSTENGMRDNTNTVASLKKAVNDLKERTAEILQTINGVSKISDGMFDLKNAQLNMKKSIDSVEVSIKQLKKKLNASVAILSIIGVLIIALQIIAILS